MSDIYGKVRHHIKIQQQSKTSDCVRVYVDFGVNDEEDIGHLSLRWVTVKVALLNSAHYMDANFTGAIIHDIRSIDGKEIPNPLDQKMYDGFLLR